MYIPHLPVFRYMHDSQWLIKLQCEGIGRKIIPSYSQALDTNSIFENLYR